jgi:hypothetical protein
MFALPGLPALAAKSRGDHPCRKAAAQRDFFGTESVTDEKVVVNGAEVTPGSSCLVAASQEGARAAASHSQVVQTVLRSELYQKFLFTEGLSGLIFVPSSVQ